LTGENPILKRGAKIAVKCGKHAKRIVSDPELR